VRAFVTDPTKCRHQFVGKSLSSTFLCTSTIWVDILVLHLKRFTFEKCPTHDGRLLKKKIEDKIDFPIDKLDLSSYVLGPKYGDAPPIYKVRSFISCD
jgi:hypothetical protein